jgi:hypothetical protein
MGRWHFYLMGLIALLFGILSVAEYVMVSYGLTAGWLAFYPEDQLVWLSTLPTWVHGLWAVHAVLALVGALCLLAHLKPAVWMLGFSFFALLAVSIWALFFAQPTLVVLTGGGAVLWVSVGLVLALSLLIYLYARQGKRTGDVL